MFTQLSRAQRLQFFLIVAGAMLYFAAASMMLYLPKFVLFLGGDEQDAGFLIGTSLVPMVLLSFFIGTFSDRVGSKPLVLLGLAIFIAATLGQTQTTQVGAYLYALCFAQGVAHALIFSPLFASINRLIPNKYRATGIGYFTVCVQSGVTSGTFVGNYVLTHNGFDGFFQLSSMIALCAVGFILWMQSNERSLGNAQDTDLGIATRKPMQFWGYFAVLMMIGSSLGVALQFMPTYFDHLLQSGQLAGPISNVYFVTSTLLTVVSVRLLLGPLIDGEHRERIMLICYGVLLIAVLGFTQIRSEMMSLAASILLGLSYGLLYPAVNATLIGLTPMAERGRISGLLTTTYEVGFRGTPIALGSVAYWGGYELMFYALALCNVIAVGYLFLCKFKDGQSAEKSRPKEIIA